MWTVKQMLGVLMFLLNEQRALVGFGQKKDWVDILLHVKDDQRICFAAVQSFVARPTCLPKIEVIDMTGSDDQIKSAESVNATRARMN